MDQNISNNMTIASKLVSFFEGADNPNKKIKLPTYYALGNRVASRLGKVLSDDSIKTEEDYKKIANDIRSYIAKISSDIIANKKGAGEPDGYQVRFSNGFFDRAKELGLVKFAGGKPIPTKANNVTISDIIRDVFYNPKAVLQGKTHSEINAPDISSVQRWDDSEHGKDPKQPINPEKSFSVFNNTVADKRSQPDIPTGKNANIVYGDDKFRNLKKPAVDQKFATPNDPEYIPVENQLNTEPEEGRVDFGTRLPPDKDALDARAEEIRLSKMTPAEREEEKNKVIVKNYYQRSAFKLASELSDKYPEATAGIYFLVNTNAPSDESALKAITNAMVHEVVKSGVPEQDVLDFIKSLSKKSEPTTVAESILSFLDSL